MLQNLKGLVERKACEVSKATKDMKELKKKWERVQRSNFLVSLNCVTAWERDELRLENEWWRKKPSMHWWSPEKEIKIRQKIPFIKFLNDYDVCTNVMDKETQLATIGLQFLLFSLI
jgi:hypothetical protein